MKRIAFGLVGLFIGLCLVAGPVAYAQTTTPVVAGKKVEKHHKKAEKKVATVAPVKAS